MGVVSVQPVDNPRLNARYEHYKASISVGGIVDGNETQLFHGCDEAAMDTHNPESIVQAGFLKKHWKYSAGDWQRFGPGFYFALQASKSHDYPLDTMRRLPRGRHTRKMLLCKVARGKVYKTAKNMDTLQGAAPAGHDSVYGQAQSGGALNYDEL